MLLHNEEVTVANGKMIAMQIIDGDDRMPKEIADDLGLTKSVTIDQEVQDAVGKIITENPDIVQKIMDGNDRPIMSLVGKVMSAVNRRGDPVVIKSLLTEQIASKTPSKTTKTDE